MHYERFKKKASRELENLPQGDKFGGVELQYLRSFQQHSITVGNPQQMCWRTTYFIHKHRLVVPLELMATAKVLFRLPFLGSLAPTARRCLRKRCAYYGLI